MTEYKIVEGDKESFENELNELSKEGWTWCTGSLVMRTEEGLVYTILLSRMRE